MLSINEKRARAAKFAEEWQTAGYESGQSQTFYNEFFEIFGVKRRRVASFEEPVKKLGDKQGFIDLFWKGMLLVEHKSAGGDLTKAKQQAFDYFPGLKETELPRYVLACDFQTFHLYDLDEGKDWAFGLQELPEKLKRLFSFIDGGIQHKFKDEDPVNIKASELMGELHDALKAAGYGGHDLERFLVRLVFCLFADDTGIFDRNILTDYIGQRTSEDGTDLGPKLSKLFEVLNTEGSKRQKTLDEDLAQFPYVNGDLFADILKLPDFNSAMRITLLEACHFDWSKVSPAIFGSLFQSVMDKKKRRAIGAHYTNEQNIMKVIGPLFLDELKSELAKLKANRGTGRTNALKAYQEKLSKITCFDPACGCGNFLVIAYRELRLLETEVILELVKNKDLFAGSFSQVDVNQFYGIEIEEFPARIAETALWMMDHIMNMRLSEAVGEYQPRIPLKAKPTIRNADALEVDWATVLPPEQCSYVFGNPPFIGKNDGTDFQRQQIKGLFFGLPGSGTLDYVAGWYRKSVGYCKRNPFIRFAFVSTNSITQGEQVSVLWPYLHSQGLEIFFAHRTFQWGSEARGKATVQCVIVGCMLGVPINRRIFDYEDVRGNPTEQSASSINGYLADASQTYVTSRGNHIQGAKPISYGSFALDDGNFTLSEGVASALIARDQKCKEFILPFLGGEELLHGQKRYCIWLFGKATASWKNIAPIFERVRSVAEWRAMSGRKTTRELAKTPYNFAEVRQPQTAYLAIPTLSSENRTYIPMAYLPADTIASNQIYTMDGAELFDFSVLHSRTHLAWIQAVCGRFESRYRYSASIVYNNFPWPDLDMAKKEKLNKLGQAILDARLNHPQSTLADLYDPLAMPADLRKAHEANDKAVDQLYRKEAFASDRARVEFLLARYEQITAPALALAAQKPKRAKKAGPLPSQG